ncbi:MAG: hypothetical protein Q7S26_03470 [bacterium]|nr:hypothetical protein [bacterium]
MPTNALRLAPVVGEFGRVREVRYERCKPDNPNIPKGARTWNHLFQTDMKAGLGRRMAAWRIRSEEVGNHFHPRTSNKDPEVFEFLLGDVDIWFQDIYGQELFGRIRIGLGEAPVLCTIPPYVLHSFIILSDHALFEEFQTDPFNPEDTYSAAEFELLRQKYASAR